jgi:DNA mismatch endonuclease (patch repair protein)
MADVFNKAKRSQVMAAIKSTGNKDTELKLIAIFRANGITGWRRNQKLPGKPDFIFRRERLAVFVDGCFWHGCPWHCRMPKTRKNFWTPKIARNKARDHEVRRLLRNRCWRVFRIWEHSLNRPDKIAAHVQRRLATRTETR